MKKLKLRDLNLSQNDIDKFVNSSTDVERDSILFIDNGQEVHGHQGQLAPKEFYQLLGKFKLGNTEAYDVAFNKGTDYIVIGRPIMNSKNPKEEILNILNLNQLYDALYKNLWNKKV